MKIYTGNFANLKKYTDKGLFPVSIALSARYFNGSVYRPLNPDRSFMNDDENQYIPKYNEILSKLDAKKTYENLLLLSNGKNVVLLCHEGEGSFCHRSLVANWLTKELNIEVKELGKMNNINL
jgi:uncharacterized protein (DUF488 family)